MNCSFAAFTEELTKLAVEESGAGGVAGGLAAGAGGAYALSKAVPRVTGRTTYYHGTTSDIADKIRQEGLKPSAQTGVKGPIDTGNFPKDWKNHAYIARSKLKAKLYQAQAKGLRGGVGETLKISLPEWKQGLQTLENPETAGGYKAWAQRTGARTPEAAELLRKRPMVGRLLYGVQSYGGERAIPHVPSEYIRGSDNYKRLGLREIGQYIKARPGRFASGVGLGALGLGGLGYGASKLFGGQSA